MSEHIDNLNDKLKEFKPTTLILGTAGSLTIGYGLYKLLTNPKGMDFIFCVTFSSRNSIINLQNVIESTWCKF